LNQTLEQAMQSVSSFVWEDVDPKIQSSVQQAAEQFANFSASNQTQEFKFENMPDEQEEKPEQVYKQNYDDYLIPYHKFLEKNESQADEFPQWLEEKKEIINQALASFQIDGEVVNYTKGPAFTRYEIMLGAGVNVKKVNTIYENLQAALQATSIRLQTPIPGKNTVGIEVPNDVAEVVPFGDIVNDDFINDGKLLNVAMGKNIDGTPYYLDITEMPHALIAGSTRSGKSVSINAILLSLILKNSPDTLKLILIDPKKVELNFYNDLPHLITPVIDDAAIASESLKWAVQEMERRFNILAVTKSRDLSDYRKKRKIKEELENLPAIVIIVDEFNDLMMQCGQEANDSIIRLAQKGRACGIHVILATQRPTVDVVNGTIKANINCRIAFRVSSEVDSRTILDESGAENLLGRGDVLIKNQGAPVRAQGAYVSVDEISGICEYITERYEPDFYMTHLDLKKKMNSSTFGGGKEAPGEDKMFLYKVAQACVQQGMCSINFIQNSFNTGFNRAQRIVTILESMEIVSPKNSTNKREILVDSYRLREIFEMD
jgi:S-DNA-T family DNA segregation ATPase FtsK/SpoIIIE